MVLRDGYHGLHHAGILEWQSIQMGTDCIDSGPVVGEIAPLHRWNAVHVEDGMKLVDEHGPLLLCKVVGIHDFPDVGLFLRGNRYPDDALLCSIPDIPCNLDGILPVGLYLGLVDDVELSRIEKQDLYAACLDLPRKVAGRGSSLHCDDVRLSQCRYELSPSLWRHRAGNDLPVLEVPVP